MTTSLSERSLAPSGSRANIGGLRFALSVTVLSGAAALAHELLWTRRLIDLLGASHESSTRVLGAFFMGLALGGMLAPRWISRIRRPWRAVALAELTIALTSLPALTLPSWTAWIWPTMGTSGLVDQWGSVVKLVLSLLVVVPPATAMGCVLPLVVAACLRGSMDLARQGLWLYGINTIGGVLGLVTVSTALLHWLGGAGAMLVAIATNLTIAALCWWKDRGSAPVAPLAPASEAETNPQQGLLPALLVATISGIGILAFEVAGLQLVMLSAPLSFYAPTAILATVILLLGISALVTPWLQSKINNVNTLIVGCLAITGCFVTLTPLLYLQLVMQTGPIPPSMSMVGFLAKLAATTMVAFGPAILAAGLIFPLASIWYRQHSGDRWGYRWGWLLAANGIGGFVGAEAMQKLVLPGFGTHVAFAVIGLLYVLFAMVLALLWRRRTAVVGGGIALTSLLLVGTLGWISLPDLPFVNPHLELEVLETEFGPEGVVSVVESPTAGRSILMSNQYLLGGTAATCAQRRQGHIPLLLHPDPKRVCFIGLATGITPGAALTHTAVRNAVAVEISPLVARAASRFFEKENLGFVGDEKSDLVIEDGRTYVAAARDQYDVIIGDLFLPWGPGEARLYSTEHFASVRKALRPQGIFCQWLAMYQLTPPQFEVIADTFAKTFGRVHLFRSTLDTASPAIALVGFRDGALDWNTLARRCEAETDPVLLDDPLMRYIQGQKMLYLGRLESTADSSERPINTLDNLWVELDAGRQRVTGNPGRKYYFGSRWVDFLDTRLENMRHQTQDDELLSAVALGVEISKWYQSQTKGLETARNERLRILQQLPEPIRAAATSETSTWPLGRLLCKDP